MKKCNSCHEEKPTEGFYRHPHSADGRAGICISCHKMRMWERRRTNPQVKEYDKLRYHNNPERKERARLHGYAWNKRHPQGYKAHYTLTNAVRDGRLKKLPCALCGSDERVHGHHKDYSRPLDAVWLCAQCHQRLHAAFPELGGHFKEAAE